MKFYIFKWWEEYGKKVIIAIIVVLTIILVGGYLYLSKKDSNDEIAFVISMLYAFLIFLITIPYNKIDSYTQERIYERKQYYYSLRKMRDLISLTVRNASVEDAEDFKNKVIFFQLITGRDDDTSRKRIEGEKIPVYIREEGFLFQNKMKKLEDDFFQAIEENDKKKIYKKGKALKAYYIKCGKDLEKNYSFLIKMYGGRLQYLLDRDSYEFCTNDIIRKIETELKDICNNMQEFNESINNTKKLNVDLDYVSSAYTELRESIDNIENCTYDIIHEIRKQLTEI